MLRRQFLQTASSLLPIVAAGLFLSAGCDSGPPKPADKGGTKVAAGGKQPPEKKGHHHAEHGPHKGALVGLGDEEAHVEIVLDAESGKLTAYVLDGEAQNPVTVRHDKLVIHFTKEHEHEGEDDEDHKDDAKEKDELPESEEITLMALSPDANGSTAQFEGQSDALKGAKEFSAVLVLIKVGDKEFPNVAFEYPEGNEDHHH